MSSLRKNWRITTILAGVVTLGITTALFVHPMVSSARNLESFLTLGPINEANFESGTTLFAWPISGQGVGKLTANLLTFIHGEPGPHIKVDCIWSDSQLPFKGEVQLLLEDGNPFGVKDKLIPSLKVSFSEGAPSSKVVWSSKIELLSTARARRSIKQAGSMDLQASQQYLPFVMHLCPDKADGPFGSSSLEDLQAMSRNKSTVLAAALLWRNGQTTTHDFGAKRAR